MLKIYYYRYDQDYFGWELWIWQKGREGSLFMFNSQEYLNSDIEKAAMVAEIDVSAFGNNEIGIIVRRGAGMREIIIWTDTSSCPKQQRPIPSASI